MKTGLRLPREHGFWTMLAAVQIVSLSKVGLSLASMGVFLVTVLVFVLGATVLGRAVRRESGLQILSSAGLGSSGLGLELLLGVPARDAFLTAVTWISIFVASTLLVRAAFARTKRQKARGRARLAPPARAPWGLSDSVWLEVLAVSACALFAVLCFRGEAWPEALALGLTSLGLLLFAGLRLTVKQVKRLGLLLASLFTLVTVSLLVGYG